MGGLNMFTSQKRVLLVYVIFLLFFIISRSYAKSIYAITNHFLSEISAYKITGTELEYQTADDFSTEYTSHPVGLALDPCSETLFVSHDGCFYLSLINAKTMELIEVKAMDFEPCGLAYDVSKQKLYAVRRASQTPTKQVYIFSWDPETKQLTDDNNIKILDEIYGGIYGIAFDDNDGIIYLSNGTSIIHMYDTANDWSYEGYFEIKPGGTSRQAVGIDVYNDGQGGRYLYAGSWPHDSSHTYLTRTDIDDPNNSIEVDADEEVIGVAADDDTGLVYVTTFNRDIRVYGVTEGPAFVLLDTKETPGGNPADIVLAGDVGYKAPQMSIEKDDGVDPNEVCGVVPDEEITYTITFAPDPNDHTNVYVRDYLPLEVEFVSADPNDGEYDEDNHTYTWYIGDVDGGDPIADLELVVRVMLVAEPFSVITNEVEIESDTSYTRATETTAVCCWGDDPDIIYVDSRATGFNTGTCWDDAYVRLESALARAGKGCGNEIWVAGGWYYPTTDGNVDACVKSLLRQRC